MTSVLAPFLAACEKTPDRAAIIDRDGTAITYAALRDEAALLAAHWREEGLAQGDRVLVAQPVSIALYRALIAIWMAGCEAIFPEPFAGLKGLRHAKALLGPHACVTSGWLRYVLPLFLGGVRMISPAMPRAGAPMAPEVPSDIALYSFTSGSTGTPKCIPRSHDFLLAQSAAVSRALASECHETDLVWFPVFVLAILANGGTAVLADSALKRPDAPDCAALADQICRHGITRLLAPPSVALALADHPGVPRLGTVFTGGGPVMPHHFARIGAITGQVVAIYGSTEAEPIATLASRDLSSDDVDAMRAGGGVLAGRIVPDLALRIVDDEIQVAGPHVVGTYLDPPDNADNKIREGEIVWHRTGDGGRLDAEGRLWLRGRLKGRAGGLWPLEVEMIALAHPGVTGAALIGMDGRAVLALAGVFAGRPEGLPDALTMVRLAAIPMDRRHASKIDYHRLEQAVRAAL